MPYRVLKHTQADPSFDVVVSMEDLYGGRARIVVDDHCYVLQEFELDEPYGKQGTWKSVTHWFREAVIAIPPACRLDKP